MHAILIDPHAQTIEAVEYSGDYKDICKLIDADLFCVVRLNETGDTLFLDDEGLYRDGQAFFAVKDYPHPLAGKGLILGTDAEGDSIATALTVEQVRDTVKWIAPATAVDMHNEQSEAVDAYAEQAGLTIINACGRMYIDEDGNARL